MKLAKVAEVSEVSEVSEVAKVAEVPGVDFTPVVQEKEVSMVKAFLKADQADRFFPFLQWQGLVDLVVVGPSHLQGAGEAVVEVTPVEVVERIAAVVEEDLIMLGEINKITCITGHLLVMVW